jgi:hypothetical protein
MTATLPLPSPLSSRPFTPSERLALAGFLAEYYGLTREAYALNQR